MTSLSEWLSHEGSFHLRNASHANNFRITLEHKTIQTCPVKEIAVMLDKMPKDALAVLGMSTYLALFESSRGTARGPSEDLVPPPERKIDVRVVDFNPTTPMKHLKANLINKFIAITGTVVRVRLVTKVPA